MSLLFEILVVIKNFDQIDVFIVLIYTMTTVETHTALNACDKTLENVYPNIRIKTECT